MNHQNRYLIETRFATDRLEELRNPERMGHILLDRSDLNPTSSSTQNVLLTSLLILLAGYASIYTLARFIA